MLNLATLALMTILSMSMFVAATVFLSRLMPTHVALRWWLAGACSLLVGGLLLAQRQMAPAVVSFVLGTTCIVVGLGLVIIALRRTLGLPAPHVWLWPVAGINAAVMSFFTHARDEILVRELFHSLSMAGVLAYGMWSTVGVRGRGPVGLVRSTGVIFGIGTAAYVASGVLALSEPASIASGTSPGMAVTLPYLYGIVLFVWLSVLVANLVSYQIRAELVAERDEAEAAHSRLELLSRTDHLTGIANRRITTETLARQVHLAQDGADLSIIEVDLDHFKQVNDTHGHAAGDALLINIAQALQQSLPREATVGRWGGEEFLIVLPDLTGNAARATADRLRAIIGGSSHQSGVAVTASLGVTTWHPGDDVEALLRRADRALYLAKDAGRDRVAAE
ncbi:MAG: c-di-GMP phosphodiesterase [Actinomycetota bacterium]|nr:c-di-GMP phosphodiesterase [Actinomycetota bacterium]